MKLIQTTCRRGGRQGISKPRSLDLRNRVLAAGGVAREAGERFGVGAGNLSPWRNRERQQGDARPKALGGDRGSGRIEAHKGTILAMLKVAPDLGGRGIAAAAEKRALFGEGNIGSDLILNCYCFWHEIGIDDEELWFGAVPLKCNAHAFQRRAYLDMQLPGPCTASRSRSRRS